MSYKQITLLFLSLAMMLAVSCKKDEVKPVTKATSFYATLNHSDWKADSSFAEMNYDADNIMLHGISPSNTVTVSLTGTSRGSFNLDDEGNDLVVNTPTKEFHYVVGSGGHVQITLNDKVDFALSGNFNAMMVDTSFDTLIIQDGTFENLKYIDTTTNIGGGGSGGGGSGGGSGGGGSGSGACSTNEMGASVGGSAISVVVSSVLQTSGAILIQGISAATMETLQLYFSDDVTVGSYPFDGASYLGTYTSGSTNFISESGTLEITEHDTANKSIKGTFSFTGKDASSGDTKEISGGSFCVSY